MAQEMETAIDIIQVPTKMEIYENVHTIPLIDPSTYYSHRRYRLEENNEDAPGTERHLLTVFLGSEITINNVKSLRILLNLPKKHFSDESNPPLCATEAVLEWMKKDTLPNHDAYIKKLEEFFKLLRLNSAIPLLKGKKRYSAVDEAAMKTFLAESTQDFTCEQARKFGKYLNLTNGRLDDMKSTRGMELVLEIFEDLNKESEDLDDMLVDNIIDALYRVKGWQQRPPIEEREPADTKAHKIEADYSGNFEQESMLGENSSDTGIRRINGIQKDNNDTFTKKYIAKMMRIVLIIAIPILLIVALVCLLFLPLLPTTTPKQIITPNYDVLFEIPLSYWLTDIDIELQGQLIADCYVDIISIKCSDAIQYRNTTVKLATNLDYIYGEKDATFFFTLNGNVNDNNHYYAWMFTNFQSAKNNSEDDYLNLACGIPPENVWCINLSKRENFTSPSSSYYFIRCSEKPYNCTDVDSIYITSRKYDYNSTNIKKIDAIKIYVQDTEKRIQLKPSVFNPIESIEAQTCMLMKLSNECNQAEYPAVFHVAITGMTRRHDLLIYPGVLLVIWLLILCLVSIGIKSVKKYQSRKMSPLRHRGPIDFDTQYFRFKNDVTTPPPAHKKAKNDIQEDDDEIDSISV